MLPVLNYRVLRGWSPTEMMMKHRIALTAVAFAAALTIAACGGGDAAPGLQAGTAPEIYALLERDVPIEVFAAEGDAFRSCLQAQARNIGACDQTVCGRPVRNVN